MFGIVLAAMIAGTGESPSWGWHQGCNGCWSAGHSCGGCGAYQWGGWGGCSGDCFGTFGTFGTFSPFSCSGGGFCGGGYCGGGYCGGYCGGGFGCSSSCNGYSMPNYGCWSSCHGSCHGSGFGCGGIVYPTAVGCSGCGGTMMGADSAAKPEANEKQATVTVQTPEGAKLTVDGKEIELTSTSQTFVTPELDPKRTYFYEMKATIKKDGKELSINKRVAVKAGEKVTVDLSDLKRWKGPKPDDDEENGEVKVSLPAEAKLFVNGTLCPLDSDERTIETPALKKGKVYHYTLKAELKLADRTVIQTKRVSLQAGKVTKVAFEELTAVASR
jgi:uncharacterized protein (TIGR03000 family)